jgi:hypothetical protein
VIDADSIGHTLNQFLVLLLVLQNSFGIQFLSFFGFSETLWNSIRRRKIITLKDLRGVYPALCRPFTQIREEIRAVAKNKDEENTRLTERILKDFIQFTQKKQSAPLDCDRKRLWRRRRRW